MKISHPMLRIKKRNCSTCAQPLYSAIMAVFIILKPVFIDVFCQKPGDNKGYYPIG